MEPIMKHMPIALGAVAISFAFALPAAFYVRGDLLSDGAVPAPNFDVNLVNAWGVASSPTGPLWIANNRSGTASVVKTNGTPALPDVAIPADKSGRPTGVVFNGGSGFEVGRGENAAPARFIFVTLEGRILGWSPQVDTANALVAADNRASGAVYTGVAIANRAGTPALYAANFASRDIEVFDEGFAPSGSFTDTDAPANYSPFGITTIGELLFVTFVPHDPATGGPLAGNGNGLIDVFQPDGARLARLATGGELDLPWAVIKAPAGFGPLSNKLLVGNFGDGRILGFNSNGHFLRSLRDRDEEEIVIDGLWGMRFGNGGSGGEPRDLYFAGGIEQETHGVFGRIGFKH